MLIVFRLHDTPFGIYSPDSFFIAVTFAINMPKAFFFVHLFSFVHIFSFSFVSTLSLNSSILADLFLFLSLSLNLGDFFPSLCNLLLSIYCLSVLFYPFKIHMLVNKLILKSNVEKSLEKCMCLPPLGQLSISLSYIYSTLDKLDIHNQYLLMKWLFLFANRESCGSNHIPEDTVIGLNRMCAYVYTVCVQYYMFSIYVCDIYTCSKERNM